MADRITQLPVEVLVSPTSAKARVTQLVVEVLRQNPPPAAAPPFISPTTVLYTPTFTTPPISTGAPYIAATTTLYTPTIIKCILPGFISPATTLYTPVLKIRLAMHFIAPRTIVVPPTLRGNISNIVPPALEGTPQVGLVMTCWPGVWSGPPRTIAYQWQYDAPGWTNITGATSSSYIIASSLVGKNLRCQVTAS